ncbi:hypothetical protein ACUYOF_09650 [Photobacterium ganghwense]|uniref:hypothetical protein n=1 Tax=Photobacterium ganghwense TaxID=320778 RepID=UPI004057BA3C
MTKTTCPSAKCQVPSAKCQTLNAKRQRGMSQNERLFTIPGLVHHWLYDRPHPALLLSLNGLSTQSDICQSAAPDSPDNLLSAGMKTGTANKNRLVGAYWHKD